MFICGKIKQLGDSAGGIVMSKKIRIGIVFISISILLSLSGCGLKGYHITVSICPNAISIFNFV